MKTIQISVLSAAIISDLLDCLYSDRVSLPESVLYARSELVSALRTDKAKSEVVRILREAESIAHNKKKKENE